MKEKLSETVSLKDGTRVLVRPIRPEDAHRLQELFGRLSKNSIYDRYLEYRKMLNDEEAKNLACVDGVTSMAFVAVLGQEGAKKVIGVSRYSTFGTNRPDLAEAAVVVEDTYQGRGLGHILLDRLVNYAKEHDIHSFWAIVHPDNRRILHFIRKSGLPIERKEQQDGAWEIQVGLYSQKVLHK